MHTNNRCFNCLSSGHRTKECRSLSRCKQCSGKHHTTVHRDQASSSIPGVSQPAAEQVTANIAANISNPSVPHSMMMTSQVVLEGPKGNRLVARALLDYSASMSLVSSRAVQCLQLPKTNTHISSSGVQDTTAKATNSLVTLHVSSLQPNHPILQISAAVIRRSHATRSHRCQGTPTHKVTATSRSLLRQAYGKWTSS